MVEIVLAEGQAKVTTPDGTISVIENATPEKKYRPNNAPTREEYPTFKKTEVEAIATGEGGQIQLTPDISSDEAGQVEFTPNIKSDQGTLTGQDGHVELTPNINSDQLTMVATKKVCDDKGAVEPNKSVFTQDDKDFDHLPNEGGQWYDVPVHSDMHDECHTETTYRIKVNQRDHKYYMQLPNGTWVHVQLESEKSEQDNNGSSEEVKDSSEKVGVCYDVPIRTNVVDGKQAEPVSNEEKGFEIGLPIGEDVKDNTPKKGFEIGLPIGEDVKDNTPKKVMINQRATKRYIQLANENWSEVIDLCSSESEDEAFENEIVDKVDSSDNFNADNTDFIMNGRKRIFLN
ncbi:hypothetical protein SSX86_025402 [Deinandra increscens subsp. villosa]|uniref:Uncharacterized protein n=1 Tax=Deinandra increscens subsp. villosa TaxID=3103831 RepID=A0AAP0CJD9_9ASTR